jgi:parallel beta-helix repeat protein
VQASGTTGIVLFPGTTATMRNTYAWRNLVTGLFAWGSHVTVDGADFAGNEEHAIEIRGYPDPRSMGGGYVAGSAHIANADVHDSVVFGPTGTLGGGIIFHGTPATLLNSRVRGNAGIGVSYQNGATGRVDGNTINDNRGAGLCLFRSGPVSIGANTIFGNANNSAGGC